MAHTIEAAKTGRASCRSCKKPINKGELRLGEEVPNAFAEGETTYHWHHPECAAKKKPAALRQALETTDLEIPNKDDLLATAESSAKTEKPANFPYAEKASTSRSSCQSCKEKIEKDDLRVAIEAELNAGAFMRKGPAYLHPACAAAHTGEEAIDLFEKIQANSLNLDDTDFDILAELIGC